MYDNGLGAESSTWDSILDSVATSVEKIGTGAKDIQGVLGKKKSGTTAPSVQISTEESTPWMLYAGLGVLVIGTGAYFMLRKR